MVHKIKSHFRQLLDMVLANLVRDPSKFPRNYLETEVKDLIYTLKHAEELSTLVHSINREKGVLAFVAQEKNKGSWYVWKKDKIIKALVLLRLFILLQKLNFYRYDLIVYYSNNFKGYCCIFYLNPFTYNYNVLVYRLL